MMKNKKPKKQLKRIEKDGKYYTVRGVELTRASGTKTEAQFWAFILSALRGATKYWRPKMDCLNEGRRKSESDNKRLKWEYSCEQCLQWFPQSKIQVDHIVPCGGINGPSKVLGWIERAFVERDGFQRLCSDCHTNIKTKAERKEQTAVNNLKKEYSREWSSWYNMVYRCTNEKATGFYRYGGRGVQVCDRWLSFQNFLADMGPRPMGTSIERLDYDGNYDIENCIWADRVTQANNTSRNHFIDFNEECLTIDQWASKLNIKSNTILCRIRRGWSVPEALGKIKRVHSLDHGSFSPWDINQILDFKRSGLTNVQIGSIFKIDNSVISRLCSKFFPNQKFINAKDKETIKKHEMVLELYNKGLRQFEISKITEIPQNTVHYIIKTAGERNDKV